MLEKNVVRGGLLEKNVVSGGLLEINDVRGTSLEKNVVRGGLLEINDFFCLGTQPSQFIEVLNTRVLRPYQHVKH